MHHHLAHFFTMQKLAAREGSDWPRLRAVLTVSEAVPHVYNHTSFTLTIYANGLPTWRKQCEIPGRPSDRWAANDLMGDILYEAALAGFDNAARCRASLNRYHPHEKPDSLPDEVVQGELLPT